jgi:hypothetical protein
MTELDKIKRDNNLKIYFFNDTNSYSNIHIDFSDGLSSRKNLSKNIIDRNLLIINENLYVEFLKEEIAMHRNVIRNRKLDRCL